ncbi:MAG: preprotein translocase subunit YajC [Lachnospiraceae bacterium]|nr:preprotein translocase subunit YajC [Ruminococcus sp.]MCM1274887.1 preprotein translocase subunit YajC [Lachnospiraceae bacterium]
MNLLNFISSATASADTTQAGGLAAILGMVLPLGVMVLIFWFLIIRPEKKRNKEMQNMLNSLQVADEVVTNGGIIGRVLSVQKDTVLIETGSDRTKIRVVKSAIAKCNTEHENDAPAVEAKKTKGKTEIK